MPRGLWWPSRGPKNPKPKPSFVPALNRVREKSNRTGGDTATVTGDCVASWVGSVNRGWQRQRQQRGPATATSEERQSGAGRRGKNRAVAPNPKALVLTRLNLPN